MEVRDHLYFGRVTNRDNVILRLMGSTALLLHLKAGDPIRQV